MSTFEMEDDEPMDDLDLEDSEEEEITSAQVKISLVFLLLSFIYYYFQVHQKILTAWRNEKLAPELLPHISDMITLMLGQVAHMEQNLTTLSPNDFLYVVHKLELERIKFLLASYLRCRLEKIEKYATYILSEEAQRPESEKRLSKEELKFAKEYRDLMENHFYQVAVRHMPSNLQQNDEQQRMVKPILNGLVLVKVIGDSKCFPITLEMRPKL